MWGPNEEKEEEEEEEVITKCRLCSLTCAKKAQRDIYIYIYIRCQSPVLSMVRALSFTQS